MSSITKKEVRKMLRIETTTLGAEVINAKFNEKEMIHQGQDVCDEKGRVYWKRHAPILFPIVGKLKKNQTMINGKVYEMPQHGFARDMEFEPITKLDNFHSYVLRSNRHTYEKFPFEFSLYVTYMIEPSKLITQYKVINEGDTDMPFGIGGHPAFNIDINNGDYYLEFEQEEKKIHFLYLVDGLIGVQYGKNRLYKNKILPLQKDTFKDDAIIMKNLTSSKISLINKKENKKVLTFDFSGFPYLAIWSKPGAPFLCIEPWQTTADMINSTGVFKEKNGNLLLKPKEEFKCQYSVEFF